jgi:hypothetical protein
MLFKKEKIFRTGTGFKICLHFEVIGKMVGLKMLIFFSIILMDGWPNDSYMFYAPQLVKF